MYDLDFFFEQLIINTGPQKARKQQGTRPSTQKANNNQEATQKPQHWKTKTNQKEQDTRRGNAPTKPPKSNRLGY